MVTEVRVPASGPGGKGTSWKEVHRVSGGLSPPCLGGEYVVHQLSKVTELSTECPFNACKRFLNKSVKSESDTRCPMAVN